jgi:hypothetical protein
MKINYKYILYKKTLYRYTSIKKCKIYKYIRKYKFFKDFYVRKNFIYKYNDFMIYDKYLKKFTNDTFLGLEDKKFYFYKVIDDKKISEIDVFKYITEGKI